MFSISRPLFTSTFSLYTTVPKGASRMILMGFSAVSYPAIHVNVTALFCNLAQRFTKIYFLGQTTILHATLYPLEPSRSTNYFMPRKTGLYSNVQSDICSASGYWCLHSHNQQWKCRMECTKRFSASNRSSQWFQVPGWLYLEHINSGEFMYLICLFQPYYSFLDLLSLVYSLSFNIFIFYFDLNICTFLYII